jgi:4-amino-4-deoxy-L-arabinose transferase-like glycosyltransferase
LITVPENTVPTLAGPDRRGTAWFLLLFAIVLPVYLLQLSTFDLPFSDESEAREALTVSQMVDFHDPITPLPNGDRIPTKPFALHWIAAFLSVIMGGVSEFSIRSSALLYSVATLAAVFFVAREMFNARAAFFSALILATSAGFWKYSSTWP